NGDVAGTAKGFGLFGEVLNPPAISINSSPVSYGFTGREFDSESGLNYNRARSYNASVGRWQSQDPSGLDGSDLNYYRYVWNAPLRYVDPTGLVYSDLRRNMYGSSGGGGGGGGGGN